MRPFDDRTIGECLEQVSQQYTDLTAIEYLDQRYSWATLNTSADEIAKGLLALGVKKGSHVGIWSANKPNLVLCFYAIVRMGAVAVMLNSSWRSDELHNALDGADVEYLFCDSGFHDVDFIDICNRLTANCIDAKGEICCKQLPLFKRIIATDPQKSGGYMTLADLEKLALHMEADRLTAVKKTVHRDDIATILFTSGTTSRPKGVMCTHFSLVNNARELTRSLRSSENDRYCVALPLFHCFCLASSMLACLHSGACMVLLRDHKSLYIMEALDRGKCTVLNAVPTMLLTMIKREDFESFDISSLRTGIIGGSYCPPDQYTQICERMHFNRLMVSLGQTEATAGITMSHYDDPMSIKMQTVGHFMPNTEGKIVDFRSGKDVGPGCVGEICIRGYQVMQGYYKLPELTKLTIDSEEWLHTGDLGLLDENGNIRLKGRIKELIIRAGENISPAEVEECLLTDHRILLVKVIGVPDDHYGEQLCACVVVKTGKKLLVEEVRTIVANRLASYKIPKYVLFMDDLPCSSSGKILLTKLREQAVAELAL